jgi:hypothetical protein
MSAIDEVPRNKALRDATVTKVPMGAVLADCMVVDYTHRTRPNGSGPCHGEKHPMNATNATSLDTKSIAAHIVVTLADAHADGRVLRLDELAADIGVRKADVRGVVTRLHAEGHVDALRLRLTLSGLALATSLGARELPDLRRREERIRRVA